MAKSNRAGSCCCQELTQPADIKGQARRKVEMETSLTAKMEPHHFSLTGDEKPWETGTRSLPKTLLLESADRGQHQD